MPTTNSKKKLVTPLWIGGPGAVDAVLRKYAKDAGVHELDMDYAVRPRLGAVYHEACAEVLSGMYDGGEDEFEAYGPLPKSAEEALGQELQNSAKWIRDNKDGLAAAGILPEDYNDDPAWRPAMDWLRSFEAAWMEDLRPAEERVSVGGSDMGWPVFKFAEDTGEGVNRDFPSAAENLITSLAMKDNMTTLHEVRGASREDAELMAQGTLEHGARRVERLLAAMPDYERRYLDQIMDLPSINIGAYRDITGQRYLGEGKTDETVNLCLAYDAGLATIAWEKEEKESPFFAYGSKDEKKARLDRKIEGARPYERILLQAGELAEKAGREEDLGIEA